jgi:NhaP-type Na+/H+ and K+/H+ antiporter
MAFISDKWRDSSVLTKAATFAMALNTLLTLVGNILIFTVDHSSVGGKLVYLLFTTGIQALLGFGILKVNRIARVFTILEGLWSVLIVLVMIASYSATTSASGTGGLMGMLAGLVWGIIPAGAKAVIGIFVLPFVLQILSMLILFFCGKDFVKVRKEAA